MLMVLKRPRSFIQSFVGLNRKMTDCPKTKTSDVPKSWRTSLRKIVFKLSGYNQYGLYTDDVLNCDSVVVREALRRLPEEVLDARNFRLIRALQLDFLRIRLPREKWITHEQDLEYRYLKPYIEEILAERMEIYEFGCPNYDNFDWASDEVK